MTQDADRDVKVTPTLDPHKAHAGVAVLAALAAFAELALGRFDVPVSAGGVSVPNVALAILFVLIPWLAYSVREASGLRAAVLYAGAVLGGMAALLEVLWRSRMPMSEPVFWSEVATNGRAFDLYLFVPYLLLLGLLGWRQRAAGPPPSGRNRLRGFALAGVLAWGLSRRLVAFAQAVPFKLDPDALGYMQLARSLASPYETQAREPLWVWVVKLWLGMAGWNAPAMRLLTVLCSMLVIWLAYRLFRDYTGRTALGVLVAWLLADHDYLIQLSVRGLREEACTAALLAVSYVVFVRPRTCSLAWQAAGLALAGAAAQLLRFTSVAILLPLLAWWGWRAGDRHGRYSAGVLLVIAAVSLPHLLHNHWMFGDPLYSVNRHVAWFRNYETVVQKGRACDGCPSEAEWAANPYGGPPITALEYVFGQHGWREILADTLEGYRRLYLAPTDLFRIQSGAGTAIGFFLFVVGLAVVLGGPWRELALAIPIFANLLPFLLLRDADPRLTVHTAPFVAFVLASGALWAIERLRTLPAAVGTILPALARCCAAHPRHTAGKDAAGGLAGLS